MVVGSIELLPLRDAVGELGELGELYPGVALEDWESYRKLYPELFADTRWMLPCGGYLVRSPEATILVDTGAGPPGLWEWAAEQEGLLPGALEELGVFRDDVDIVFLTHLHNDHVGWSTEREGAAFFPRARYVVHRGSLAFARAKDAGPHLRQCILPLVDRFETVDGDVELAPGVTAFVAPGHYPGHMALRLESGGAEAMLIADVAVHPALLDEPDWVYVWDGDPTLCAQTRRALLPRLVDRDVLVACGHYPGTGIGRLVTRDGHVVWEEAT